MDHKFSKNRVDFRIAKVHSVKTGAKEGGWGKTERQEREAKGSKGKQSKQREVKKRERNLS